MINKSVILAFGLLSMFTVWRFLCEVTKDSLDTAKYAPSYTEKTFQSIKIGDTTDVVMQLIGKPLATRTAKWDSQRKDWRFCGDYSNSLALYLYSVSTNSSHYRQRSLIVDLKKGVVVGKISRFYVD